MSGRIAASPAEFSKKYTSRTNGLSVRIVKSGTASYICGRL